MTNDKLEQHARQQARRIVRVLADAVGIEVAANAVIRAALEDLLQADELTASEVFKAWADERQQSVRIN